MTTPLSKTALRTTLPAEIAKHNVWSMAFGSLEDPIGDEPRDDVKSKRRPFVVLSDDQATKLVGCFALAPSTGRETGEEPDTQVKPLLICVPVDKSDKWTKDSLLLTCQADTMDAGMLWARVSAGYARCLGMNMNGWPGVADGIRSTLTHLLLEPIPEYRPSYAIGNHVLTRGSVVELAEYPPGFWNARTLPGSIHNTFWIVVSTSLWLHILANASRHSKGICGLVRDLLIVAPLIAGSPNSGELVAEVRRKHPVFPNGAYCRFHRFRSRSLQRLVAIHEAVDRGTLDDIDAGLRLFLGLR